MPIKHTHRHGKALVPAVQERLRALVNEVGEYKAAEIIGIGYPSIARAVAGLGLRRGTVTAIEMRLDAMKTPKTQPKRAAAK